MNQALTFKDFPYERPDLDSMIFQAKNIIEKLKTSKTKEEANHCIQEMKKITDHFETMETLVSVRNSINTVDAFYETEMEWFDENSPKMQAVITEYYKILTSHKLRKELETIYGTQWFLSMEISQKTFCEEIMEDLVEESKLVTKYDKLLAGAKIDFDGKTLNLSGMSVYSNSLDRNIRYQASKATEEFFLGVSKELDQIYDDLVRVRTSMARKMGYENYVDFGYLRLGRTDYTSKDVKKYRRQVEEFLVPFVSEIMNQRKKDLNLPDMKFYDQNITFLDGNPKPKYPAQELVERANQMYGEMSQETKEFFQMMIDKGLLDLETKPNKQGGGYTTYITEYEAPFIFSNFNGTSGDVDVLTHEAGHAFEVYEASKSGIISDLYWPTLEACEIHSMSMEFFAHPWMKLFFEEDTNKYLYKHLEDSILFIPYGVCVDEFQEWVYSNPEKSPLERKEYWKSLEHKYLPDRDYGDNAFFQSGAFWQRQGHIYSTAFYYIDYTLAQVCAFQFYLADLKNHKEAWNTYLTLCKMGGSKSFLELLKAIDMPNPFMEGTIAHIVEELKPELLRLKKNL